jgi:hypothetical protein
VLPILVIGAALATQAKALLHEVPLPANARRDKVADLLNEFVEKHLILVRYTGSHSPHEEWVYNGANIDAQDIVWAHDLGPVENARLVDYYKGRRIWLFQPDVNSLRLDPYGEKP